MIALYIIGGLVAYLLIGMVVAGIWMRVDDDAEDYADGIMFLWPLAVLMGIVACVASLLKHLAKRIGGVKD